MTKVITEYRVEGAPLVLHAETLSEWLNSIAKDGWRLVAVDRGNYVFEKQTIQLTVGAVTTVRPLRPTNDQALSS